MQERFVSPDKEKEAFLSLRNFAALAQRLFFANELRQEDKPGKKFNIFEFVDPYILKQANVCLNKNIQEGGFIAVIDSVEGRVRVQAFNANHYLRIKSPVDPFFREVEERRAGKFSIRIYKPGEFLNDSSLSVDVQDALHNDNISKTSWTSSDNPRKRFAVLSYHQKKGWDVILDARILPKEGEPSWKVNTSIFS